MTEDAGAHTPAEDEAEQLAANGVQRKGGDVVPLKEGAHVASQVDKPHRAKAAD